MVLSAYYLAAIPRAFWLGWQWAVAQGFWLTFWIAICTLVTECLLLSRRVSADPSDRRQAMNRLKRALAEGSVALGGGMALLAIGTFVAFFIQDAPKQANTAQQLTSDLQKKVSDQQSHIEAMAKDIAALKRQIGDGLNFVGSPAIDPKFSMRLVVQTSRRTQPTFLTIKFDGKIAGFVPSSACGGASMNVGVGRSPDSITFNWGAPAFTPECPMIFDIESDVAVHPIAVYFDDH